MPVRAGLLDRRVVLKRRVETVDSSRQAVISYWPIATVWARVEPLGGREQFGQQQWVASGDVRFTVRWRKDMTPLHVVTYDDRDFDVVTVAEDGRREGVLIVGRARAEKRAP